MKNKEKYVSIFRASHALFLSQGYDAATIRQISTQAQVSLGLTNHFFRSKQELAAQTLDMILAYTGFLCDLSCSDPDPLLRAALNTRVSMLYLYGGPYRSFYLETLKQDVWFHKLEKAPNRCLYQLASLYDFPVDDDLFLLYGTYVPYHYEKTLMLNKEQGLFSTIAHEDIPDYVSISMFEHFLDQELLNGALTRSRRLADTILKHSPSVVPDEFLSNYIS